MYFVILLILKAYKCKFTSATEFERLCSTKLIKLCTAKFTNDPNVAFHLRSTSVNEHHPQKFDVSNVSNDNSKYGYNDVPTYSQDNNNSTNNFGNCKNKNSDHNSKNNQN